MSVASYEIFVRQHCHNVEDTKEKGRYAGLSFDCPNCHKERHANMRLTTGKWTCFKCSAGGDFLSLVSLVEKVPKHFARRMLVSGELMGGTGGKLDRLEIMGDDEEDTDAPMITAPLPEEYQPVQEHPYLASRLVSPEEARHNYFGQCLSGKYKGRIIIPILERATVIGFVARDFTGKPTFGKKILNPPISISRMVWNIDTALLHKRVVVCEGVFSALRVGSDAVATFGKNFSREQMFKLKEFGVEEVVLMFDSDVDTKGLYVTTAHGQRIPNPVLPRLRTLADIFNLRIVRMPFGDPGDQPKPLLRRWVEEAKPYSGQNLTL